MAWEWSHAIEAYCDARTNVENESREFLEIAFAEWHGSDGSSYSSDLDLAKHDAALVHAKTLSHDVLADFIWNKAESQKLCDNGGWNAWMCPYGCHTVSFSCTGESE